MDISTLNLPEITCDVCSVARKAGAFILNERKAFSSKKIEVKGHNDFVSYVDKGAEKLIVEELKNFFLQLVLLQKKERKNKTIISLNG